MSVTHKNPEDAIRELTDFVSKHPQQVFFNKSVKSNLKSPIGHIENCAQAFLFGALPSAETVLFIARAFERYLAAERGLTLDDAFGLKSVPRVGNAAEYYHLQNVRFSQLNKMVELRAENPKLSIEKAAAEVCGDSNSSEAETLARQWKRENKEFNNYWNKRVKLQGK